MLLKFEKLREERPKVRRVFDEISDFCDKMLVVNYIILFVCSVVIIGVPTALAFYPVLKIFVYGLRQL